MNKDPPYGEGTTPKAMRFKARLFILEAMIVMAWTNSPILLEVALYNFFDNPMNHLL